MVSARYLHCIVEGSLIFVSELRIGRRTVSSWHVGVVRDSVCLLFEMRFPQLKVCSNLCVSMIQLDVRTVDDFPVVRWSRRPCAYSGLA